MKPGLVPLGVLVSVLVLAQESLPNSGEKTETTSTDRNWKRFNYSRDSLPKILINLPGTFPQAKLSHTLPNGNKVYLLPQDGMPCLVPNASLYNFNMPVLKGKKEGNIPNPAPKIDLIPKPGKVIRGTQKRS